MYIKITDEAQAHFRSLLASQAPDTNIRIFVINPGKFNAECGVSYCEKAAVEDNDESIQYDGFITYIDNISYPYLENAEIDYVTDELGSLLTLQAPNAKIQKVADDAPLIDKVEYAIQTEINPQIASHGGTITLIDIKDDYAILQFGGGCNGCAMIDVTLKDGVEKQLLEMFPDELKGVKDITEHMRGEHSYY